MRVASKPLLKSRGAARRGGGEPKGGRGVRELNKVTIRNRATADSRVIWMPQIGVAIPGNRDIRVPIYQINGKQCSRDPDVRPLTVFERSPGVFASTTFRRDWSAFRAEKDQWLGRKTVKRHFFLSQCVRIILFDRIYTLYT